MFMARDPNALIGGRKPEAEREVAGACSLFHAKAQRREEDIISLKDKEGAGRQQLQRHNRAKRLYGRLRRQAAIRVGARPLCVFV